MNTKVLVIIALLLGVLTTVLVGSKVYVKLVDHVANRVYEKLLKDYSPSPYGPGVDPDKIDVEKIRNIK